MFNCLATAAVLLVLTGHAQSQGGCCTSQYVDGLQYSVCSCQFSRDVAQLYCSTTNQSLVTVSSPSLYTNIASSLQSSGQATLWTGGHRTIGGWQWTRSGYLLRSQGCYTTPSSLVPVLDAGNMTVDICLQLCGQRGADFAGIQFGRTCYCSPSISGFSASQGCTTVCSGNNAQFCGGYSVSFWWAVNGLPLTWYSGGYQNAVSDPTAWCMQAKCTLDSTGAALWSLDPSVCTKTGRYACQFDQVRGSCAQGIAGLITAGGSCLLLGANNEVVNWTTASQRCSDRGGRLMELTNEQIYSSLFSTLQCYNQPYWVGSTYGDIRWITGEPLLYSNWANSEPNSDTSKGCLSMSTSVSYRYQWSMSNCEELRGFICQAGVVIQTTPVKPTSTTTSTTTTTTTTTTTPSTSTRPATTTASSTTTTPSTPVSSKPTTTTTTTTTTTPVTTTTGTTTSSTQRTTKSSAFLATTSSTVGIGRSSSTTVQQSEIYTTYTEIMNNSTKGIEEPSNTSTVASVTPGNSQPPGMAKEDEVGVILIVVGVFLIVMIVGISIAVAAIKIRRRYCDGGYRSKHSPFVEDTDFSYVNSPASTIIPGSNKPRYKVDPSERSRSLDRYESLELTDEQPIAAAYVQRGAAADQLGVRNPAYQGAGSSRDGSSPSDTVRPSIDGASHHGSEDSQQGPTLVLPVYDDNHVDGGVSGSGFIQPISNAEYDTPPIYTSFA